jgi:uroporphyrinogen-III decarboxylase
MAARLDALRGRLGRDLFVPVTFRFALKLEQTTWSEAAGDPGLASFALRSAQRLFKADGLVNWFDDWLEAEGAGVRVERDKASGSASNPVRPGSPADAKTFRASRTIKAVIDLTRRLCAEVGNDAVLLGYLTGGATLLSRLYGEDRRAAIMDEFASGKVPEPTRKAVDAAAQLGVALANAYCEAGAGALVLAEHDRVADATYLRGFEAIFNVARYLDVPILMLCKHVPAAPFVAAAKQAGVAHVASRAADDDKIVAVPAGSASEIAGFAERWARGIVGRRLVLTEWDAPADTAPEHLMALQKKIAA